MSKKKSLCARGTNSKRIVDLNHKKMLNVGCRIPQDFFITKGKGESDITVHAGSYHLALKNAGIEMCNIITYSSILPKIAKVVQRPKSLIHGSVMETIMAVSTNKKGKRATASIIFSWLYDKKTGVKYGGLVCEYNGTKTIKDAEIELRTSLHELYTHGFEEQFELRGSTTISETIKPTKRFGTAIVSLCFVNYVYPLV
ncbi:arginine decarboxylase [Candidatus Woesearchaeota archaeon CG10_big_fil_rev_8_21_14_0_10_36_11]|nr:MAG: arginine decarboxylase [Candidatus Woesearchaeota archaeon CG10_big_fil_rev_8_21_14_0_10_36_11]